MKKLALLLCALLLLGTLCFPAYATDGYELLSDGDFESGDYFAWFPYYLSSLNYVSESHSGNNALKVTNRQHYTDVAGQYVTDELNFYGPGTYVVSAYVKLADADARPVNLQIAIGYHTSAKQAWATSNYAQITADSWTLITAQVNLQWSGELEKAEFYIISDQNQEGTDYRNLLIDDCSMKTVTYQGPEYAPETTEAPTTEPPTTEAPTTEAPTETPTEAPTAEESTEEAATTLPEQTDAQAEPTGRIKTQTWILSGVMFAGGLACLVCGAVPVFKKKS